MMTRTFGAIVGSLFLVLDGSVIQYSALHHYMFNLVMASISATVFFCLAVVTGLEADSK